MVNLASFLSVPKYAAGLAAVITILVKMIDNKLSNTKSTVLSYLKSALFSAGLVGFWVYMMNAPASSRISSVRPPPMSAASAASAIRPAFGAAPPPRPTFGATVASGFDGPIGASASRGSGEFVGGGGRMGYNNNYYY